MKKALIVIDMQNDFVSGSLANEQAQAIVSPIAAYVNDFDGDVIATRDTHGENYLSTAEGRYLPVVHCVHGTLGWQIADEIHGALIHRNAIILDKPTFGYLGWELSAYDEIELVGTCTDICVVSNALIIKAKFPNLTVKVHASLCAGTSIENHNAALKTMACCQVQILP